ncbi:MAG: PAS domain-containing protein [bacterium]|nr:PAS domain-containing protein [bacterium]
MENRKTKKKQDTSPDSLKEMSSRIKLLSDTVETLKASLKASEDKFQAILGNIPAGTIYRLGDTIYMNQSAEIITGYKSTDIKNIDEWIKAIFSRKHEIVHTYYEKSKKRGMFDVATIPLVRKDGMVRYVELASFFYRESRVWIVYDITEHKQSEDALWEIQQKFRNLIENISDWVWETDMDGIFTYTSPQVIDILGYHPNDILGRTLFEFIVPDEESARIKNMCYKAAQCRESITNMENINLRKNGRMVYLETSIIPMLSTEGHLKGFRGMSRDISKRKQAERALLDSEMRYRALVEDMPALICRFLVDGKLTFVNDAYCEHIGKKKQELIGRNFFELFPVKERLQKKELYKGLTRENPIVNYIQAVTQPDGIKRIVQWTDRALFHEDGEIIEFQSIGLDIIGRKAGRKIL